MSKHDEAVLLNLSEKVSGALGLSVEEALRGIQYGIELAQKEALDAGDRERADLMRELFEATIRVGRRVREGK